MMEFDVNAKLDAGWQMIDLPSMTSKVFSELVELLGKDLQPLALSVRETKGEKSIRGSALISPNGMDKLKSFKESKNEESNSDELGRRV